MSGLFAFMILVSCSDGLQDCRVADDFLNGYTTSQQCERVLVSSMRKISMRGEQVLGRCLTADSSALVRADAAIYWHVDRRGNFHVEIREEKKTPVEKTPAIQPVLPNYLEASVKLQAQPARQMAANFTCNDKPAAAQYLCRAKA